MRIKCTSLLEFCLKIFIEQESKHVQKIRFLRLNLIQKESTVEGTKVAFKTKQNRKVIFWMIAIAYNAQPKGKYYGKRARVPL